MDTTIDKIKNSEALIKINLKEDDYQPRVTQKIKDFSKKANIKGFRPGKVPTGLIKKMYGSSFLVEEVNSIISEELNKTLRGNELQFLGEPMPTEEQSEVDWENQKDFEFIFKIGYAEEFELKLEKIKVDHNKIKVDKAVLNETIENLQKQFGETTNPEEAADGDTIYGTAKSEDESINQEVSIDTKELTPATLKKVIGLKKDDVLAIDAKKSFKDKEFFERASRLTEDELKAVKNKLSLTISAISRVTPAEVNQELFDKAFGKDVIKDQKAFETKVKETVETNYESEALNFFYYKIREKLVDSVKINLPDEFLKSWLIKTNEKMTEELLETEYQHYATELKWSLIRNKIAKDEEVKVEHEEVVEEAKKMIVQQFGGPAIIEQLGDQLNQFADNYLQGENGDNYMKVYNQVQGNKVYEILKDKIASKEKAVSLDEFRKLK
ncbi:MAG: trigger factor [Cyclobacteriaceae bacterium]